MLDVGISMLLSQHHLKAMLDIILVKSLLLGVSVFMSVISPVT